MTDLLTARTAPCALCRRVSLTADMTQGAGGWYCGNEMAAALSGDRDAYTEAVRSCTARYFGTQRQEQGQPVSEPETAPESAEPLPVLPEAQEKALTSFLADHDAEDAREAEAAPDADAAEPEAEPGTEDREDRETAEATGPCDGGCTSVLGKGPCDCGPEAPDDGEPAAEQDEAPAPVAEVSGPAPQDNPAGD